MMKYDLKHHERGAPVAGFTRRPELDHPWVTGFIPVRPAVHGNTATGPAGSRAPGRENAVTLARLVPAVSTRLTLRDRIGDTAVRWDIGRQRYGVLPGLYAVGDPDANSTVLVTANYKFTFDRLRRELAGLNLWLLVLDTRGVNVWCAAGKGTFGTGELLTKLRETRLAEVVSHGTLVLPQLGASGVSAPEVARESGFRVVWGPVRAADLPAFLADGMRKTAGMRRVGFTLRDRLAVAPVELVHAWPFLLALAAAAAGLALPAGKGFADRFLGLALILSPGTVLAGTILFPAVMPWLPFRAFSAKGALLGVLWGAAAALRAGAGAGTSAAIVLVTTSVTAYLAMNFTGASTFTCQEGAQLEVDRSIVPMLAALGAGIVLGVVAKAVGF